MSLRHADSAIQVGGIKDTPTEMGALNIPKQFNDDLYILKEKKLGLHRVGIS
jgi:hypothetical protein